MLHPSSAKYFSIFFLHLINKATLSFNGLRFLSFRISHSSLLFSLVNSYRPYLPFLFSCVGFIYFVKVSIRSLSGELCIELLQLEEMNNKVGFACSTS